VRLLRKCLVRNKKALVGGKDVHKLTCKVKNLKAKILLFTSLLALNCSIQAQENERQKKHNVTRVYQALYGPSERCKLADPAIANAVRTKFEFVSMKYQDTLKLVTTSPYFSAAMNDFQSSYKTLEKKELNEWCNTNIAFMSYLFESESSAALMEDLKAVLSR
jgi:5-methylthioribose kinase